MKRVFILLIPLGLLFAERGDLISADVMATKDPNNNQLYIDDELSALAGESFFNLTVEYGFWLYKLVYETVDNSIDEALAGHCDSIEVIIKKDGTDMHCQFLPITVLMYPFLLNNLLLLKVC